MPEIEFRATEFQTLGKNGFSTSCGIQVQRWGEEIVLQPINSKGDIGRARLVVPVTHVRRLIDVLDALQRLGIVSQ